MTMVTDVSPIWTVPLPDLRPKLQACIDRSCQRSENPVTVFFRVDDAGAAIGRLIRLLDLFAEFRMPLALSVVPAWITAAWWKRLQPAVDRTPELWCWHQHGWGHVNHEPAGKKSEFGPARTAAGIRSDLKRGRKRLAEIFGDAFVPIFTPPWNRCDGRTLHLLRESGYLAVSRSRDALPPSPEGLPDLSVHIDLHTRKGRDPKADLCLLIQEMEAAFAGGCCGIMVHHTRMNRAAFSFLEALLDILCTTPRAAAVGFREMV